MIVPEFIVEIMGTPPAERTPEQEKELKDFFHVEKPDDERKAKEQTAK